MKKSLPIFLWSLAAVFWACGPTELTWERHLLRFENADPSLLLVSVPDRIVVSRSYATGTEISVESRDVPAPLSPRESAMALKLAGVLRVLAPDLRIVNAGPAGEYVTESPKDPRGPGVTGYKLARARVKTDRAGKAAPKTEEAGPSNNETWDDRLFEKLIVISRGTFNNTGRTLFRLVDAQAILEDYDVNYLLLVELTDVEAKINPDRIDLEMVLTTRLLSLSDGLLIFEKRELVECNARDAVTGPALLTVEDMAALEKDGFKLLGDSLELLGERYGLVVAVMLGMASEDRLAQARKGWEESANKAVSEIQKVIVP